MLEGLAAWVLNTYVGEYLENLNTDQLSIGLLQGAVELENLPLKKDALKGLDLPVEVIAGFVGKITLQIPMRRMRSEPWVISIDKLYLVAGPTKQTEYNEEKEKKMQQERKQKQLDAFESKWKLNIRDVHIRYEDSTTIPNQSFAFGITITKLSAQSTDGSWVPKFVSRDSSEMMYKLVELQDFALYWDLNPEFIGDLPMTELADALQRNMFKAKGQDIFQEHEYILKPVSAKAKFKRNLSAIPLRSRNNPRIACDLQLTSIPLELIEHQYRGIVALIKEYERYEKARRHRKWRPLCKVKESPKLWWKFAINATLHCVQERNNKQCWFYILNRGSNNVRYVHAYTHYLTNPTMAGELKEHKDLMETELSFEELRILREVAMERIKRVEVLTEAARKVIEKKEQQALQQQQEQYQGGVFQRWFPGWGGWYSYPTAEDPSGISPSGGTAPSVPSVIDEEEMMAAFGDSSDDDTFMKRDNVFALLNFSLNTGTFRLSDNSPSRPGTTKQPIMELKFDTVNLSFESRPRSSSMLFNVSLDALYLTDLLTEGSLYPKLVQPQCSKDKKGNVQGRQYFGMIPATPEKLSYTDQMFPGTKKEEPLFVLVYEKRPTSTNADYRLEITSRPLDMIYNPKPIRRVSDFFSPKQSGMSSRPSELHLTKAARIRYEELKNQTRAELLQAWDQVLEGGTVNHAKRWAIHMDVSAPHIIIPDNFQSPDAMQVILDLGHLEFANTNAKGMAKKKRAKSEIEEEEEEDDDDQLDDDDDFATPLSSPGEMAPLEEDTVARGDITSIDFADESISESTLRDKLYDRYTLDMSDLQVIVAKGSYNWKRAYMKGTSAVHVVDRFTISVQLERRIISTTDPQWPSATLSGTLPKLVLHVNENKIHAIRKCINLFSSPKSDKKLASPSQTRIHNILSEVDLEDYSRGRSSSLLDVDNSYSQQTSKELVVESRQLLMQFSVDQVSLEVQSRGRCIAELQVSGVKANLTKRPFDTSVSLTVHGLLLVDALTTFGGGFELLMASHKNLSMDIPSGSMLDSDPSSPASQQSPVSPQSPASPTESSGYAIPVTKSASHSALATAFAAMRASPDPGGGALNLDTERQNSSLDDTEALITAEFEIISPNCPTNNTEGETLQIASVQFNNLDLIANQETVVELLGFFKRVLPTSKSKMKMSGKSMESNLTISTEHINKITSSDSVRTELTADFHRLNVLLLRGIRKDNKLIARKVGTATMTGAHIQASVGADIEVDGFLGGLQVVDLTPEGAIHSKVFSIGDDVLSQDLDSIQSDIGVTKPEPIPAEMYKTAYDSTVFAATDADIDSTNKAFYFSFHKSRANSQPSSPLESTTRSAFLDSDVGTPFSSYPYRHVGSQGTELKLRMASLCYTHSPRFIAELSSCASEFKMYMSSLAVSITQAATEVAKGIVTKRDYLTSSMGPSSLSGVLDSPVRKSTLSLSESLISGDGGEGYFADDSLAQSASNKLKLDIVMQTPVVAFPRTPTSSELLVGHLGKIYLHNVMRRTAAHESMHWVDDRIERMYMEIRDINVFSINSDYLSRQARMDSLKKDVQLSDALMSTRRGDPILHNTTIELTIDQIPSEIQLGDQDEATNIHFEDLQDSGEATQSTLKVTGRVVTPLKVVFAKHVFEQVLQTLDNLTFNDKNGNPDEMRSDASIPPASSATSLSSQQSDDLSPDRKTVRFEEGEHPTASDNLPSPTQDASLKVVADFELPVLDVTLQDDFGDGNQDLVELAFKDFKVNLEKSTPYTTSIQVALGSLIMEDLLQPAESKHRYLMVSTAQPQKPQSMQQEGPAFLSSSCPIRTKPTPAHTTASSLPASLQPKYHDSHGKKKFLLQLPPRSKSAEYNSADGCPATPPPSIRESSEDLSDDKSHDALVHINLLLVDRKCPEFYTKYRSINRLVDIDFNSLDTTINLQTWVVLLTFFGIGTPKGKVVSPDTASTSGGKVSPVIPPSSVQSEDSVETINPYIDESHDQEEQEVNSEFDVKVQSLTLILNKPQYELARANVSKLSAHVGLIDGNMSMSGSLGRVSLMDLTPYGELYRERFVTTGEEALGFDIFKYGSDDPFLVRECDIKVELRMSSVRYIHTHRFQSETVAFCEHFNNLHNHMGHTSAVSKGKEIKIKDSQKTASRIKLDVEAGSPVILFPKSSSSTEVLVANLGNLTIKNQFLYAGSPGTKSVILKDLDVFTENYVPASSVFMSPPQQPGWQKDDTTARSPASVESSIDSSFTTPLTSPLGETAGLGGSWKLGSEQPTNAGQNQQSTSGGQNQQAPSDGQQPTGPSPLTHRCLLDVMHIDLVDMYLYSAERLEAQEETKEIQQSVMVFPTFIVKSKGGKLLKKTCMLKLQVERNLNADFSRIVPNFSINGMLSSIHCSMDRMQFNLIKGFLDKNLGEPLEEFEKPVTSYCEEPVGQTILSGRAWPNISMTIDLVNVSVELLKNHEQKNVNEASLARIDFIKSKFSYESFSDQSKTVDLVSHAIVAHDTRYQDKPEDSRPNVFLEILSPTKHKSSANSLQAELHYRSTQDVTRFTMLLNNMRVMGIFDWLIAVKEFLANKDDEEMKNETDTSSSVRFSNDMSSPRDKYSAKESPRKSSMSRSSTPVSVGSGIYTKRAPIPEQPDKPFELKLNITETEFVVVENMACWDTNAVILKSTAVLSYKPSGNDKPMSCSLQSLEVFSCSLSSEEDTALSIIDPVTVSVELNSSPTYTRTSGLLDATVDTDVQPSLEVQIMQTLNIRVSYHDIKLFMAILNSLPKQAIQAVSQDSFQNISSPEDIQILDEAKISSLEDVGFERVDCIQALKEVDGRIDAAASWLLENAIPRSPKHSDTQTESEDSLGLSGVEIRAGYICICLIDDCKDCDVPLAEISLSSLYFLQKFHGINDGLSVFRLSGDYYNRYLSGWEPFLEPWKCKLAWQQQPVSGRSAGRLVVEIKADDRLDFNLTSSLIELYRNTKKNWTEDYYNMASLPSDQKRRQPFVPYALRNQTGCKLEFATKTSISTGIVASSSQSHLQSAVTVDNHGKVSEWKEVQPNEELPFVFESRVKLRHRSTHELKLHQIVVRVDGWQESTAVSVDKVGIVFRQIQPKRKTASSIYCDLPPARVVFDVTLEGSARKVVTVRSSLMIISRVHVPMELKMIHPSNNASAGCVDLPLLSPNDSFSVPMPLTYWNLYVRPRQDWGVLYCEEPIHWRNVAKPGESRSKIVQCLRPGTDKGGNFRLCACVRRDGFPADFPNRKGTESPRVDSAQQPGHTITLLPPVVLTNLLPYDLNYYIKGTDIRGQIKPGKDEPVYQADLSQVSEYGFGLENYPECRELVIPVNFYRDYKVSVRVMDNQRRLLFLNVQIEPRAGKSLKISISAPYWLVNKSGIPLVFRQDSGKGDAAGQFEEHELARSLSPLLFSYSDKECPYLCTMRLGKGVHGEEGIPNWCQRFSLEGGTGVRSLHVIQHGLRPDWVYNIGIDIRKGLGRYHETQIVTFVPRYQLDNRSRFKISFAQRHFVKGLGAADPVTHLSALSGSSVLFHWPRDDLDRLLCIRIADIEDCKWSGGIQIDKTDSFHINMRGSNGRCIFLHVEITMKAATFFATFTDADQVPPPYRLDNLSGVPILYYQSQVADNTLRTIIKPRTKGTFTFMKKVMRNNMLILKEGRQGG
uniref:Vacuolar protein sorting-associated protein 13D-like n=1 Tax=Saccoglossus kowalevskii TaxID=10224 RepID=A0ABM0GN55_SACKO|nr:PREDICTED: vacuolar protein sorting-associated protein 13D-like [Saccoglossus kowalevskii]